MIRVALSAALLLTACAATADRPMDARQQAELDRALAGLRPGAPMHCLRHDQANSMRTFQGTILYVAGRARMYRNNVVGDCAGLAHGDIVVWKGIGSQYCRGDIIETRSAGPGSVYSGSCSLGEFIPFTR